MFAKHNVLRLVFSEGFEEYVLALQTFVSFLQIAGCNWLPLLDVNKNKNKNTNINNLIKINHISENWTALLVPQFQHSAWHVGRYPQIQNRCARWAPCGSCTLLYLVDFHIPVIICVLLEFQSTKHSCDGTYHRRLHLCSKVNK